MHKPRVYSYLRFSDPRQAAGSSADRQTEYARRWAAERGLVLDEALSMRDEGLSAYHQKHVKQGALGVRLATYQEWERGARFADGRPVQIDRRTALACAALAAGLAAGRTA